MSLRAGGGAAGCGSAVFEDARLSYGELERAPTSWRIHLPRLGLADGVGLGLKRRWRWLVGLLRHSQGGGAYLPLDPS